MVGTLFGGVHQVKTKTVMRCIQLGLSVLCLGGVSSASVVTYGADVNGSTALAWGIGAFTTGTSMAGMMTVSVNGGAAVLWTAPNTAGCPTSSSCGLATSGGAGTFGNGAWTLQVSGNPGGVTDPTSPQTTPAFPWTLTNTSTNTAITSVVLRGDLSNSCFANNVNPSGCIAGLVFDRDRATFNGTDSTGSPSADEGTPGGNYGVTYRFSSESGTHSPFTVNVVYSDIVALQNATHCNGATYAASNPTVGCGDSWATLTFTFSGNAFQAGATNAVWSFFQDTDAAVAPEPLTIGLMGAGLLALVALRKRRVSGASR
jgi:hypothetical protein